MTLRFIYFNFPFWRAEVSRLALHIGKIPFEDVRPTGEMFRAMKAAGELPYGQLPVLDINGTRIGQSVAIARYCGKRAGLYPEGDALAEIRVDELLNTVNQISNLMSASMREKDPDKKAALRTELGTETLPRWLGFLEARLKLNAPSDYFVGDSMTVADLAVWRLMDWLTGGILDGIPSTLADNQSALLKHQKTIGDRDDIRKWMSDHYGK